MQINLMRIEEIEIGDIVTDGKDKFMLCESEKNGFITLVDLKGSI